jgi:hypothetical protein
MLKRLLAVMAVLSLAALPASAEEIHYSVDANGVVMDVTFDNGDFGSFIQSLPEGRAVTVCFESTSIYGIDWLWTIDVTRSGMVVTVVGGFIGGTICDAPNWNVTGGTITATSMQLNADYVGGGSCAAEVDLSGSRTPPGPRIWSGEYGFPTHAFPHDTEFIGFGPC